MNNVLVRADRGILGGEVWIGRLDVGRVGRCGGRCCPVFRKKKGPEPSSPVGLKIWNIPSVASQPRMSLLWWRACTNFVVCSWTEHERVREQNQTWQNRQKKTTNPNSHLLSGILNAGKCCSKLRTLLANSETCFSSQLQRTNTGYAKRILLWLRVTEGWRVLVNRHRCFQSAFPEVWLIIDLSEPFDSLTKQ